MANLDLHIVLFDVLEVEQNAINNKGEAGTTQVSLNTGVREAAGSARVD